STIWWPVATMRHGLPPRQARMTYGSFDHLSSGDQQWVWYLDSKRLRRPLCRSHSPRLDRSCHLFAVQVRKLHTSAAKKSRGIDGVMAGRPPPMGWALWAVSQAADRATEAWYHASLHE